MNIHKSLVCLLIILSLIILIYFLGCYSIVKTTSETEKAEIMINFLLPMNWNALSSKLTIIPEIPGTPVSYNVKWLSSTSMLLYLEQKGTPQGQELTYRIHNAPTLFPFVKKSVSGKVRPEVPIKLIKDGPTKNIPSHGPFTLTFNTQVDPESLKRSVILPVPGRFTPCKHLVDGKNYTDYSRWLYIPDKPFKNSTSYRITIKPDLYSLAGTRLTRREEILFTTGAKPVVVDSKPVNGDRQVSLYRTFEFTFDREIYTASLRVVGPGQNKIVPGKTEINKEKVIFQPSFALLPNNTYEFILQVESKEHENSGECRFSFKTVTMGEKYWVDVKLGETHTVTVYQGDQRLRHMLASGGRSDSPTPMGTYYTQDRGYHFWSRKFGEGGTYWIRLVGQILIHSVPKDNCGNTKEEEHAKLGLPASHGCIRLDERDARWVFENLPPSTPVIIHP